MEISRVIEVAPGVIASIAMRPRSDGHLVITAVHFNGSPDAPVTSGALERIQVEDIERSVNDEAPRPTEPLIAPPSGAVHIADFLRLVAAYYRYYDAYTKRPVLLIAQAAGVSSAKAQSWVSGCRILRLLPPGSGRRNRIEFATGDPS